MKGLFQNFDFHRLESADFKEDSVRETIILPILHYLGFKDSEIVRSKSLAHPFLKVGSQKRQVNLVPDYLLQVDGLNAWVLDAKAPKENINTGEHTEQIYSYAIHPEIRTKFFALCNGFEFVLYRDTEAKPILIFPIKDWDFYYEKLESYVARGAFSKISTLSYEAESVLFKRDEGFDYLKRPFLEEIPVRKQAAKRHFGVHGYFTKQSWNVVREYIENFSQPGDLVLDPFGGSGVTAIEAMMLRRKAIHIDINPMSVFMVDSLMAPVHNGDLKDAFETIKTQFLKQVPTTKEEIQEALKKYPHPKGLALPKDSDVEVIEELFSDKQLAELGLLKSLILKVKDVNVRKSLLLAFSSTLTKTNLTYHNSKSRDENSGNSAPFAYYRYRLAPEEVSLDLFSSFETKISKIISAKKEISYFINASTINDVQVVKDTATNLHFIKKESVDYIYTDPPYGKKIPYLDLSVMWNGWLDLEVTEQDYALEAIEGGEHHKSKDDYNNLIAKSIDEMYRVLKFDRWMSFVFAHKDPEFWHLIIDTAEKAGFEYVGAVKQANGQTSFKKRQNPFTVLAGQLIVNFRKVRKPKSILKAQLGTNIGEIVMETIEAIIAKHHGATLEQINDALIIRGLEQGFLHLLKKEYSDLTPILMDSFRYDEKTERFYIIPKSKFKTHVDERLRIKYYLISYLNSVKKATFDAIVLEIIPLLKNGTTPENQTVLNVLKNIAIHEGNNEWTLKIDGQTQLFK
ncbi:MAG: DNA methyltransferase [Cytophagales bacterium]